MSIIQRKTIMNVFINSQFSCCPLIRMCHSRTTHSPINNIHERALRIVYKDNNSQLLEKASSITIHHRNLQVLVIEVYKALNNLSSSLMSALCKLKETKYSFRNETALLSSNKKTTNYGINSLNHLAPKILDFVPA